MNLPFCTIRSPNIEWSRNGPGKMPHLLPYSPPPHGHSCMAAAWAPEGGEGRLSRCSCRGPSREILPGGRGPFAPDFLTGVRSSLDRLGAEPILGELPEVGQGIQFIYGHLDSLRPHHRVNP
jgi:hypothetical protein